MLDNIYEPVDYKALVEHYIVRDGYVFIALTFPYNVFDAVLVRNPLTAPCFSPRLPYSERTLEEHIALINNLKLEKAVIIANDISFIKKCPSLKHLKIVPADDCGDGFDYSPIYNMTGLKRITCTTIYGKKEEYSTTVDFSKIKGIEDIGVSNCNHLNYSGITTLKGLGLSNFKEDDLKNAFSSTNLDTLMIIQSKLKTLDGIQKTQKMQCLYLYYNRYLRDISVLKEVKQTLRALRIENCPQIDDFSVLGELDNLELLELSGSNELPDLSFIKKMKRLKTFIFSMNVKDGDLSPCLSLSYVRSKKNRKHFNLKDSDFPKGNIVRGNENIEEWRRLE